MNKILTWAVSQILPFKLDGVKVLMVPGLGAHVEVVFPFDVFTFWGGSPFLGETDEQFRNVCRNSISAAAQMMQEAKALEIHMSWDMYQKLRRGVQAENRSVREVY